MTQGVLVQIFDEKIERKKSNESVFLNRIAHFTETVYTSEISKKCYRGQRGFLATDAANLWGLGIYSYCLTPNNR
jgi:hypothetical protein